MGGLVPNISLADSIVDGIYRDAHYFVGEAGVRLGDKLDDNSICRISSSLYFAYNVRVTAILEDMDDFFTYSISIDQIILRV